MSLPLVSVHIITFNQKDFIRETLDSVLSQDYENFEVIVADDGSSDGTDKIILEYKERYPDKIQALVGGPNLGITGNSNRGLKMCKGEFIAFMGGDDVFLPGKLSAQIKWFFDNPAGVICGHKLYLIDEKSIKIGLHPYYEKSGLGPKKWIEYGTLYGATSVMIKAKHLPKNGFDERLPAVSDWKLYVDSLSELDEWGSVCEYLAMYRKHGANITNNHNVVKPDVVKTIDLFFKEKPQYTTSIRKAKAIKLHYSEGYICMRKGDYRGALRNFKNSLICFPYDVKIYFRIVQASFLCLLHKPTN